MSQSKKINNCLDNYIKPELDSTTLNNPKNVEIHTKRVNKYGVRFMRAGRKCYYLGIREEY